MMRQAMATTFVRRLCWTLMAWALGMVASARALERVTASVDDAEQQLVGEVAGQSRAGDLLLRTRDGGYHRLSHEKIRSRHSDDEPFALFDADQLEEQLLAELPAGFRVHRSTHYVVCYNTTQSYAQWTSALLERLQKAFLAFWKNKGCSVEAPKQPLIVLVFADQQSYAQYARRDLGAAANSVIGYYSPESNRILMYDLTGMQALHAADSARGSKADVYALLTLPEAEPLVATIVHEAAHQISFNCQLQTRLADNPLWLSEGLAVVCETPDLNSSRSWSGIGKVNYARWDRFRDNVAANRHAPLARMLADDDLFRDGKTAVDSYAQAWAWNYFLMKWRPKPYAAYLKLLAAKPLLQDDKPAERVADFRQCFGEDLKALEDDFYRRMDRVK